MQQNLIYLVHLWEQNKLRANKRSGETARRRNTGWSPRVRKDRGQVAEVRWARKGGKEHNNRDERLPEN